MQLSAVASVVVLLLSIPPQGLDVDLSVLPGFTIPSLFFPSLKKQIFQPKGTDGVIYAHQEGGNTVSGQCTSAKHPECPTVRILQTLFQTFFKTHRTAVCRQALWLPAAFLIALQRTGGTLEHLQER